MMETDRRMKDIRMSDFEAHSSVAILQPNNHVNHATSDIHLGLRQTADFYLTLTLVFGRSLDSWVIRSVHSRFTSLVWFLIGGSLKILSPRWFRATAERNPTEEIFRKIQSDWNPTTFVLVSSTTDYATKFRLRLQHYKLLGDISNLALGRYAAHCSNRFGVPDDPRDSLRE